MENVSVRVENKRREHSEARRLLREAMARLERVEQELVSAEKDSARLVRREQEMLASAERAERSSAIDRGAIVDVPGGLSFDFSGVDLSSGDWSSLLSVPVGSPEAAVHSGSNYFRVPRCIRCPCTLSILRGTCFVLLHPYGGP